MVLRISFADLTHTGQLIASNTFPYGVSLIAQYARQHFEHDLDVFVCKYPDDFSAYLDRTIPHVACFANYSWNCSLAYAYAERIKQVAPDVVTIFGGPNYPLTPDEQQAFLMAHPAIDFYIQFEGERAFVALLRELNTFEWNARALKEACRIVPSVHYLAGDRFVRGEWAPRIAPLDEIPSPYLAGLCDRFFDGVLIPMVQTNRGCPFLCTFCTEGQSFYNKVNKYPTSRVIEDLTYIAERATVPDLIIVDSNFGMFKEDLEVARYLARLRRTTGWPQYIHVSTGKNNKERVLDAAALVEGSMSFSATIQSADPQVLHNIKRSNISIDQLVRVAKKAGQTGANSYSEIILGLPGDSLAAHRQSILSMIDADINVIRMYQLIMLPGSEVAQPRSRQQYRMQTRFRVMPRNFGRYRFRQDRFACGEIEEICVANETLSFADYVACRDFNLTVELFYNGGIFWELVQFLKWKTLPSSLFVEKLHAFIVNVPHGLTALYDGFRRETIEALSPSRETLQQQLMDPREVQKYIAEEKGNNELFKYRALGFFYHMDELHDVAFRVAEDMLRERDLLGEQDVQYLRELKRFSVRRKRALLEKDSEWIETFHFDFPAFAADDFRGDPGRYTRPQGLTLRVRHTDEQKAMMARYLRQYGSTLTGLGRILLRSHVRRLYRTVAVIRDDGDSVRALGSLSAALAS